jgi:glycosyltransferase involved in cell wall biosynthesis
MLFFISHPIQYVSPLLKEISCQTNLIVYYYCGESKAIHDSGFGKNISWDIPLLDGYEYSFLKNLSYAEEMNSRFFDAINPSIFKVIRNSPEQVIVLNGWAYFSDWLILLAAKFHGKKVWMRAESPWNQFLFKKKSIKGFIKFYLFKYFIFKYFINKFLYIGVQNKLFYLNHCIDESRLIYAPYSVDNDRLQLDKVDWVRSRHKWGIDKDKIVILFSGKFIRKKRPMDLLRAFQKLGNDNALLFFMGDGPMRIEMESFIKLNNIKNVILSGFINQSEISSIYSLADLFVMCSGMGETWGLSINEAMNFSLPIIVSSTCGAAYDLVEEGENGFIIKEGDIDSLTVSMNKLIQDKNCRYRMGLKSKEKIQSYCHQITTKNIIQSLS